jgi:hypothetical protein
MGSNMESVFLNYGGGLRCNVPYDDNLLGTCFNQ